MDIFIICIVFSLFFLSGAIFFMIFPTFTHYLCIFTLKNARFWALACNKDARLFITLAVGQVLKTGAELLGIEMPDKM